MPDKQNIYDIYSKKFLPSMTSLIQWREKLDRATKLAKNIYYVQCDIGTFDLKTVRNSVKLLAAKDVKSAVSQELDWFSIGKITPRSVKSMPSIVSINNFKSLLWNHDHSKELSRYGMTPNELSRLCCKRYISGDQVHWIVDKLNSMQSDVLCVYLNRVSSIERYIAKKLEKLSTKPSKLAFVINIGKNGNGETFIASDAKQGNHWTLCVFDKEKNVVIYGDSLGWDIPNELPALIN